ncbi:MAG: M23 family metallopeptidase [Bacilli bacterium]|nr:M23 family metallopeptidase [Bacilli bacterium]
MTIEDYLKTKNKPTETKTKTIRKSIINRTLITTCIVLSILVICNISEKFTTYINKYVFETNYNFAKINAIYKKYMLELNPKKEKPNVPVSKNDNLNYYEKKDYLDGVELSIDENYNVTMLESGLIVYIGEKEGYGNCIVVQQSNGIDVTYGNVKTGDIKIYDYIEKGKIIGTASKKLYITFASDGEYLDYKTYIK